MEIFINITSQGQISIPAKIRKNLGFEKTNKAIARTLGNKLILEPAPDILTLAGLLKHKAKKGKNIQEIIKEEKKTFAESFVK